MDDLISRQTATQAIAENVCAFCPNKLNKANCNWPCAVNNAIGTIKEIEELHADNWIPVTERLPEDDVSVLVSYIGLTRDKEQYKGVTIATYDSDFEGWYRDNDFAAIAAVVTAWQPLPEPYEGGEQ